VIVPDASKIYRDKGSTVNRTPAVGRTMLRPINVNKLPAVGLTATSLV